MSETPKPPMQDVFPGVVKFPGDSPVIAPSIRASVDRYLASMDVTPGQTAAMLELTTETGVNLALVHKGQNGKWGVDWWIGKSGWQPADGWQTGVRAAFVIGGD